MPGPFPGMDPYLETPDYLRGLHQSLICCITQALNNTLPLEFAAYIEERFYDLPGVVTVYPDRMHESFIEIRTGTNPKRVVTIIEVLSPANKAVGSEGRQEYQHKQEEVLQTETHLLEIDLLRRGAHTVSVPRAALLPYGTWDYLICLHHSTHPWDFEFWMNRVRERLPRILVPLTEDTPDVTLDLQAAFDQAYDAGPYWRDVDYRQAPSHPLEGDEAQWTDALLRAKGLRS